MRQKIRAFFLSLHEQLEKIPFGWSRQFLPEDAPAMDHKHKAIASCIALIIGLMVMMFKR